MKSHDYDAFFAKKEIMVVLTTSTAGLGHKRVTAALEQGLPDFIREEELGVDDPRMQAIHRIASHNVYLRWLVEFSQNTPVLDGFFARTYSGYLRRNTEQVYERLEDLIQRRRIRPKIVLIVSTHFSMAHELAEIKEKLAKELKTKIVLAVTVTDDSPQKIWAVRGADYIFMPSFTTKNRLLAYFDEQKLKPVPEMVVKPYPVSLELGQKLTKAEFKERTEQVKPNSKDLRIMIPISGAAVQLKYLRAMVENLSEAEGINAMVVTRETKNTLDFINWGQEHPNVGVIAKTQDSDVVGEYDEEYLRNVYAIEITKPSEQSFKTLLTPKQRGGVIMLFSKSVGRQEDDNVRFMTRHGLLPNDEDASIIKEICIGRMQAVDEDFLERARKWRGILLPMEGAAAGELVKSLHKLGVFAAMTDFAGFMDHEELTSNGVEQIWEYLEKEMKKLLK